MKGGDQFIKKESKRTKGETVKKKHFEETQSKIKREL
jgi:hypothetical protein